MTLREFAGWIIEHPYLWDTIEDIFSLSPQNTSITPGLRRRRSESLGSMYSLGGASMHRSSSQLLIDDVLMPSHKKKELSLNKEKEKSFSYSEKIPGTSLALAHNAMFNNTGNYQHGMNASSRSQSVSTPKNGKILTLQTSG